VTFDEKVEWRLFLQIPTEIGRGWKVREDLRRSPATFTVWRLNPSGRQRDRHERLQMKPAFVIAILMRCVSALGQAPSVEVWAVPSVAKVRPDDRVQGHNLVWDKSTKTISIAGAKNEHVPFQIVITVSPPSDSHHPAASGFFEEASDLVSGVNRLARDQVKLYFEHVILCPGKSSSIGETGFWPDALAPLTDPFSMRNCCRIPHVSRWQERRPTPLSAPLDRLKARASEANAELHSHLLESCNYSPQRKAVG